MAPLIATLNTTLFGLIGILHLYWAQGGKWGSEAVLPSKSDGNLVLKPSPLITILVAIALFGIAYLFWIVRTDLSHAISKNGLIVVAVLFGVRAIGDFRYIGFTKSIKNTRFSRLDTRYYSPFCLYISLTSLIIRFL